MEIPMSSWLDPRVEVRDSQIHGRGLMARRQIRAGDTVAILGGSIVSDAEVRDRIASGGRYDGIALDVDRNLVIEPVDWPGRYGNHSCEPNLWMSGPVTVVAARDIEPGEELTIDYALHTLDPSWRMSCSCHSSSCRGRITGSDWRLPGLQDRYRGHWPPVLQRRIDADPS
jgi:uncharacterized protein